MTLSEAALGSSVIAEQGSLYFTLRAACYESSNGRLNPTKRPSFRFHLSSNAVNVVPLIISSDLPIVQPAASRQSTQAISAKGLMTLDHASGHRPDLAESGLPSRSVDRFSRKRQNSAVWRRGLAAAWPARQRAGQSGRQLARKTVDRRKMAVARGWGGPVGW